MCKGSNLGDAVEVEVTVPASQSYTKMERKAMMKIDKCLAPLIIILNAYGIKTTSCCCGHGKTKKSYVGISAKNIHLGKIESSGLISISLEFLHIRSKDEKNNVNK